MLLILEKGIAGGIRHSIHRYAKENNKYMKNMIKTNNYHIFNIRKKALYGWVMSQMEKKYFQI